MTESFFMSQMHRIMETFGAENYPRTRNAEIWKVVCELKDHDFEKMVDRMVGDIPIKYPPTVMTFREHAQGFLKDARDKELIHNFNEPKIKIKTYETSDEALDEVAAFFNDMVRGESFPEWLRLGFKENAKRLFPELNEEVERLKARVKAGSIEARSEYAHKAKQLMIKTATRSIFRAAPKMEDKEGA